MTEPLRLMLDGTPCWCVSEEDPHEGWIHAPVCLALRAERATTITVGEQDVTGYVDVGSIE